MPRSPWLFFTLAFLASPAAADGMADAEQCQKAAARESIVALELADDLCTRAIESRDLDDGQLAATHTERARAYVKLNEPVRAAQDLRDAIILDPAFVPAYLLRAELYLQLGSREMALENYDRASQLVPDDTAILTRRANLLLQEGKDSAAISDFERVVSLDPDNASAHANLGSAQLRFAHFDAAIGSLSKAIELSPDLVDPLINRARALTALGRFESAVADLDVASSLSGESPETRFWRSWLDFERGDYGDTIRRLDALLVVAPDSPTALALRGYASILGGEKAKEGITDLRTALELMPNNVLALDAMGLVAIAEEQFRGAEQVFTRALAISENYAPAYFHRAVSRLERHARQPVSDLYRSVTRDLNLALQFKPHFPDALATRGFLRFIGGDDAGASSDLETAIAMAPSSPGAYVMRATASYAKGNYDAGLRDLTEALDIDPTNRGARMLHGWIELERDQFEEAIADLTAATTGPGAGSSVWINLAMAQFALDDFLSATTSFEKAAELNPRNRFLPLWSYLSHRRAGFEDLAARQLASADRALQGDAWPRVLYKFFLGEKSAADVMEGAQISGEIETAELGAQADYFLAQFYLASRNHEAARDHFRSVIGANLGYLHLTTLSRLALRQMSP